MNKAISGVPVSARDVPVAKFWTSLILVGPPIGVANKLSGLIGVLVTLGGCEYGWLHAEAMIETSTRMEATIAPRFILAMGISSISNKVSTIVAHHL